MIADIAWKDGDPIEELFKLYDLSADRLRALSADLMLSNEMCTRYADQVSRTAAVLSWQGKSLDQLVEMTEGRINASGMDWYLRHGLYLLSCDGKPL